ncbi:membrane-bound lytic murein transglycosylase D [Ereboglobus sp. PH5-10]|uniref:lytic transglycosylase domain-containing protein n=1 Tax=Ereboglobus sp. PH5-10 TaxID=2940629 RepID=UPI002404E275|nr:lytic transglycosylase domain-containing protein [Ereboglobus sp. PH5-10]MDF9826925.1 membrane-bound lytic murein transglycosylase D [Ereboglobus sp. PH5-10]
MTRALTRTNFSFRRIAPAAAIVVMCALPALRASDSQPPAEPISSGTAAPVLAGANRPPLISDDDMNALYDLGRQLFEDYAPGQIKEHYEFMSRDEWASAITEFQQTLETGSLEEIASLEPKAKRTLNELRAKPEMSEYTDWFAERLELIESAKDAISPGQPPALVPAPKPPAPFTLPPITLEPKPFYQTPPPNNAIPYYNLCHKRVSNRAKPKNADLLAPLLKIIFATENIPVEFVWLAEVESSFNPLAKSPVGARGLYQLMPATARALGLSTAPEDERIYAVKNARAAARLLGMLYKRFNSWPLALAAYNAGEGRVAVALKKTPGAKTYADIAAKLPAETRLYVPQVLATLVIRENVPLEKFVDDLPPIPAIKFPLAG